MDQEHDRITPAQVQRIEALCAVIDAWGSPRLRIQYEMREGVWEVGISISTGQAGQDKSQCFHAQSEPLRSDGYGFKTAQEAFQNVCEQATGAAQGEMASIDKQIENLKARRLKLKCAVVAFASSGWGK
jgi:hypothetical protein